MATRLARQLAPLTTGSRCSIAFVCVFLCLVMQANANEDDKQLEFFENRIRPLLVEHCYQCHTDKAKGGLRLDSKEAMLRGGDSGASIVPGKAKQSLLVKAVNYESLEMPPKGKLPAAAIADLEKWIDMGAVDPRTGSGAATKTTVKSGKDHWAFKPVRKPNLPSVKQESWPLTGADYFVLKRLEENQLPPAPDADRYTWLRRVHFDLIGLPPGPDDINAFVTDPSPQAYERVVDRLLNSRAYGERWARHWLDLVGYADQIGTSNNVFAEFAWKYRDYLVNAFVQDKPYDQFVREQIAGDLLTYESVREQADGLTATGFLVLGDLEIVEADKAKLHVDIIDQQLIKTSKAFLAMTIGCARCHDHKFDPIRQRDYYAIAGFFHGTESIFKTNRGVWSDVVRRPLPETSAEQQARKREAAAHATLLNELKEQRAAATKEKQTIDQQLMSKGLDAETQKQKKKRQGELTAQINRLNKRIEHAEFFAPRIPQVYAVRDSHKPVNMRITIRGNPRALGDEVPRGFMGILSSESPKIQPTTSGRKALADWIASPENPLTARVAVNRIWQKLFGEGLVSSVDYFGVRGDTPTHPKLLDFLAAKFARDGWSQKRFIRSLVLSRTYRMSADHHEKAHQQDPQNRLLWRANRRRLDAESLRDALLVVTNQLQPSSGGPSMPLEFPENVNNISPKNVNPPSFALNRWRPEQEFERTLYLPVIRSTAQPGPAELRNVFDFTQPAAFAGKRDVTSVPTQALFLLNSPFAKRKAASLAKRIEQLSETTDQQLELLWMIVLNRPISQQERKDAESFLQESGLKELCHAMLASNEFLMKL